MIAHSFYNLGWRYAREKRQNSISRSLQPGLELGEGLCQHSMESDWQGAAIVSLLVCRVQLAKLGHIPGILNTIGAVERKAAGLETKPWHAW